MAKDANFKEYLTKLLVNTGAKITSSLKVGELPLEIDMYLSVDKNSNFEFFSPFQRIINHCNCKKFIIEYKSYNDHLSISHLYKIIGYRALYLSRNLKHVDPSNVGIIVITTKLPRKILSILDVTELSNGVFLLEFEYPIYLIAINYLSVERENYGFLFFSSGKKLTEFIRLIVNTSEKNDIEEMFISYATLFYYEELMSVNSMDEIPKIYKNVRAAVHFFGIKEVVDAVGLKEVVDAVGLKEVINVFSLKEVIDAFTSDDFIDNLDLDDIKNLEMRIQEIKKSLQKKQ